jgi:hypothetical protein
LPAKSLGGFSKFMFSPPSLWEILFAFTLAYYVLGFISLVMVARTTFVTKRMEAFILPYLPAAYFFVYTPKLIRFCCTRIWKMVGDSDQYCPSAAELQISLEAICLWIVFFTLPIVPLSVWLKLPLLLYVPILASLPSVFFLATSKLDMRRNGLTSRQRRGYRRSQTVAWNESVQTT